MSHSYAEKETSRFINDLYKDHRNNLGKNIFECKNNKIILNGLEITAKELNAFVSEYYERQTP